MRALRQRGHHVTVACENRVSIGWLSRLPHERLLLPSPNDEPDAFIEKLSTSLRNGGYDVTIPLFDIAAHLVCQHKGELQRHTRIPLVDLDIFMRARDKGETMRACQENGVPCPKTYFPEEEPIDELAKRIEYPVLVKPRVGHGAIGIKRVNNADALAMVYTRITEQYGPAIIQEFIPQSDIQYKAQLFLDREGTLRAAVVFNKLRYFPIDGGTSSINQTVFRPDIVETGRKLLEAIDWTGYADLDLIQDPRTNVARVMEINPRVTGSVKIAFEAGVDFADLLVCYALEKPLQSYLDYKVGVTMRYLPLDILWFFSSPDRFRAEPSWFHFWGRDLCYQVLSVQDPGPFLGLGLSGLARLLSPKTRAEKFRKKSPPGARVN